MEHALSRNVENKISIYITMAYDLVGRKEEEQRLDVLG